MKCDRTSPSRQRGVTLVELIITMVLMGLLAAVGATMISDTFQTTRLVNAGQASADQARYAMERLSRELREVKYVSAGSGYAVSSSLTPAATNMVFTRVISGADVTVTITKSGSNLSLGYSSPAVSSVLASQVSEFALDFLQLDNSAASSGANLRFVVITLTVTDSVSGQAIRQQTRVALRNA